MVTAAHDEVGLHAQGAQLLHRVLRGLGFHLMGGCDIGHQRHVRKQHVARRLLLLELASRFYEREGFYVADGAADLRYDDVGARLVGQAAQARLDSFGDMGDHLHGAAQIVAAALAGDEALVD